MTLDGWHQTLQSLEEMRLILDPLTGEVLGRKMTYPVMGGLVDVEGWGGLEWLRKMSWWRVFEHNGANFLAKNPNLFSCSQFNEECLGRGMLQVFFWLGEFHPKRMFKRKYLCRLELEVVSGLTYIGLEADVICNLEWISKTGVLRETIVLAVYLYMFVYLWYLPEDVAAGQLNGVTP